MNEQQVSESILALASAVAGKDLTDEGDGSKATALSVLGNVVGEVDADTALYNAAQFATRRSTDTKDAAASVLALSQGGGSSKELLFEETVETSGSRVAQAKLAYSQFIDADTIYVTYDGVTYTCSKVWDEQTGVNTYGAPNGSSGTPVFSDIPFSIISRSQTSPSVTESYIATETEGTHTVKVEVEGSGGGGGASFGNYVNIDCGTDEPSDYMDGDAVPVSLIFAGDYPTAEQMMQSDNIIAQLDTATLNMAVEGTSLQIPLVGTTAVQAVYLRTITGTDEQSGYIIEQTAYTSYEVRTGLLGNKSIMLKLENIPAPYDGNNPSEIYIKYSN